MSNIIPFPVIPRRALLALVAIDADELRTLKRALQSYGAICVECVRGADEENNKLMYAACADDAARLGERLERLPL